MASWNEITADAPEFATRVHEAFDHHKHKVIATLRKDGSPRISGTELEFQGGELWIGSMPGAMKALDLQRDARYALHSAPIDLELKVPDVKIAGTVTEITDEAEKQAWSDERDAEIPPGPFHLFRLDVTEVVCTWVDGDKMHVESWRPGRGIRHDIR